MASATIHMRFKALFKYSLSNQGRVTNKPLSSCHRVSYHSSSYVSKVDDGSTNDRSGEDEDSSKDWIPPQRPLSGDLGRSEVYAIKTKKPQGSTFTIPIENDDILNSIEQDENKGENVQFIDLDNLNLETLKKQLEDAEVLGDELGSGSGANGMTFASSGFDPQIIDDDDDEGVWADVTDEDMAGDIFDAEDIFETDDVLREIINDAEFDVDDEEVLALQMEMIKERIEELQKEQKQQQQQQQQLQQSKTTENKLIHEDNAELDEFLKQKNLETRNNNIDANTNTSPDWLKTRRSKLTPIDMLTPVESSKAQKIHGEIKIIKHTLLSSNEIINCLTNLGGSDVELVIPDEKTKPHLGWEGLVIATGSSFSHIRVLTDAIVTNLRKRDLAKRGVVGAMYGSEGGEDTSSSRRRKGLPKKMDDGWIVVDCGNYVVHVQDHVTRMSLDLKGMWSPGERGRTGRELRNLDRGNDDDVEDYVANNPVPDEYTESLIQLSGDFWGDGQMRGGFGNITKTKSGRWTPGSNEKGKFKNRAGRGR